MTLLRTPWKTEARGKGGETGLQGCLQTASEPRTLNSQWLLSSTGSFWPWACRWGIGVQVLGVTAVGLCFALAFSTDYLLCILRLHSACSAVQLCVPMNCSPPGSSVHGISQARILEWVAISSSRGSLLPMDWTLISYNSCIAGRFFTTKPPWKP